MVRKKRHAPLRRKGRQLAGEDEIAREAQIVCPDECLIGQPIPCQTL
jgi:hypothetical protein